MITEQLLQFIWQYQYFNNSNLQTNSGELLQIIQPGLLNKNQGPDFLNGKIKCGDTTLVGSIELHINASEWVAHNHSADPNYNNVILHVVWQEDKKLLPHIPVLELQSRISNILIAKYKSLMNASAFIPCGALISKVNELTFTAWKERLMVERLQEKSTYIENILAKNNHHWEETFWQILARNFGVKINSDAFEKMASTISINILAKHKNQIHQLEALLLGQSGLLNDAHQDDYYILLQKEYQFLKQKYNLQVNPFPVHFLRMRPANFPTIRLAQLAALISESNHLFSKIKEAENVKEVEKMFSVTANDYWHYHYQFEEISDFKIKTLGSQMIKNVILNTAVPMLYTYGWHHNEENYKTKALDWAAQLSAEKNNITLGFEQLGVTNKSAYDSQALIQLKNRYCVEKKCLDCAVGNSILKTEI